MLPEPLHPAVVHVPMVLEIGEAREDRVEAVVTEEAIHTHEEGAEVFLPLEH